MSDETPNRQIGGLAPRSGSRDLSRLQRRNRPTTSTESPAPEDGLDSKLQGGGSAPKTPSAMPATAPSGTAGRMTTYLSASTRGRARAAYRATSHLEGDRSWSSFVERAILAEVERREAAHNSGHRYTADSSPLSAGRPLTD